MIDKKMLLLFGVIGAAAVFAATRTHEPAPDIAPLAAEPAPVPMPMPMPGEPTALPPGHPPLEGNAEAKPPPTMVGPTTKSEASLTWTVPARWQVVPHPSTMRIVTYRVPRFAGDSEDGELSVTRAGGDIEQNALRWVAQFDEKGRTAKRATKKVSALTVHLVDVEGTYTSMKGDLQKDWAMFGAIVDTPNGSHFFKLTGPKKTVARARAELDALIASIK